MSQAIVMGSGTWAASLLMLTARSRPLGWYATTSTGFWSAARSLARFPPARFAVSRPITAPRSLPMTMDRPSGLYATVLVWTRVSSRVRGLTLGDVPEYH